MEISKKGVGSKTNSKNTGISARFHSRHMIVSRWLVARAPETALKYFQRPR